MEDAIERKLYRELSSRARLTEARVVYILAEIRKLIERTKQRKKYYALTFHCSWAVHTMMDSEGAVRILRRFDEAWEHHLQNGSLDDLPGPLKREINETMGLKKFRDELRALLRARHLPTKIVDEDWTRFLRQYAAVIEDCALTVKDERTRQPRCQVERPEVLKHITQVTVHKGDADKKIKGVGRTFKVFRIRWVSYGKNKKTGTIETYYTIP